jgi:molybdate transport system ATP-binding protein
MSRDRAGQQRPLTLSSVAEILEIDALLDRRVQALSGGERQRVALGRALMTAPTLLLLDEPLAGVDRARRERILPYLLRIRRELHVPLVYVTHDTEELRQIADRVLVIEDGRLVPPYPSASNAAEAPTQRSPLL